MKFIDRLILLLNKFVYRVDAFLQNIIDFLWGALYLILLDRSLGLGLKASLFDVYVCIIVVHMIYMITYVINDYINYFDDLSKASQPSLYSFYMLRPVQYFKRSPLCLSYFSLLSIISALVLIRLCFPNVMFIILLIFIPILSIIESYASKWSFIKLCSFYAQRMVKYTLFSFLLQYLFVDGLENLKAVAIFPWILSITAYVSLRTYVEAKSVNKAKISLLAALAVLLPALIYFCIALAEHDVFVPLTSIMYSLGLSSAIYFISLYISKMLLGFKDTDYYRLLTRLALKLAIMSLAFLILWYFS